MKEFEKWAGPAFYYGKDCLNRPILKAKQKAWKAALGWAHTKLTGDIMLSRRDRDRIDSIIKKELAE